MPTKAGSIPKKPTVAWLKRELRRSNDLILIEKEFTGKCVFELQRQIKETDAFVQALQTRLAALLKEYRLHSKLALHLHQVATTLRSAAGAGASKVTWERAADLLEDLLKEFPALPPAAGTPQTAPIPTTP